MRFLEAYQYTYKNFGFSAALNLIVLPRLINRLPWLNIDYNETLRQFIRKDIAQIIEKYKQEPVYLNTLSQLNTAPKVFTLWWQGANLPEVVRLCRHSLKKNIGTNVLVELDKNNIGEYIEFPQYVYDRLSCGHISLSNFSDLVRVSLLAKYGGTWIDSCIYVLNEITYTGHLNSPRFPQNESGNQGKWCFGIQQAPQGHKLMRFMAESMLKYWEKHSHAVDYLMMDSFMMIAYEEFSDIRGEIDKFTISSPDLHRTRYLFDKQANYECLSNIIQNNQFLSLTWRIDYPNILNGKETYYGALKRLSSNYNTNEN